MKVMTIGIKNEKDAMKEFAQAFESARKQTPFTPVKGAYFTSLEAVRNLLTHKRLALVHIIPPKVWWKDEKRRPMFQSLILLPREVS